MNIKEYGIIRLRKGEASFAPAVFEAYRLYPLDLDDYNDRYLMHDEDLDSLRRANVGDTITFVQTRLIYFNGAYSQDVGLVDWVRKDDGSYLVKCDGPTKLLYYIEA